MKESGIEKLIELFKDYVENYGNDAKDPTIDYAVIYDGQGFYVGARFYSDEKVLSKKFGFIKWLVENDKIDTSKANDKNLNGYEIELRIRAVKELVADSEEKTVLYLNLLMLLSISDTPIEDLCGYLKDDSNITKGEIKIGSKNQDTQELDMTTTHIEGKEFLA